VPVVTALRAARRGRVAVHVDGEFLCAVSDATVARWRLHKGRELDESDVARLVSDASSELVLSDAYRLLGHRARSVQEVRSRLLARGHAPEAVETVLQMLLADRLLDDVEFARAYVADKHRLAGWGAERIRRGLAAAGVSQAQIDEAIAAATADDAEDAELQRALDVLRRRTASGRPDDAARRRAYQALLRRGFASGVAYAAVKVWSGGLEAGHTEEGMQADDGAAPAAEPAD
jgi:regulatory protein